MTGRWIAGLAAALALAGPAAGQVTFRSVEVIGITDAARGGAGPRQVSPHEDAEVRFWSNDGRSYTLDGFGCRFRLSPLRGSLTPADAKVAGAVQGDVAAYRASAASALGEGGELIPVALGELTPLGPSEVEGAERYGFRCDESLVSAYSLDVIRRGASRRLRILVLQTQEGEAAGPSGTLAVSVMENITFRPREEEALARAAPMTRELLKALTR